jgi:hypothetical protein
MVGLSFLLPMRYPYSLPLTLFIASLLAAYRGWAQAPVITGVLPLANARAVAGTSPVSITFSQPLTAASVAALRVFSAQRGGLRSRAATPAVVSGNTLSFAPTAYAFRPGEAVQYTVGLEAASAGGPLAQPRVGGFTTAVGGTGRGTFVPGGSVVVGNYPDHVAVGDVDGDGDLDLLSTNYNSGMASSVSVRFNNGNGTFGGGLEVPTGTDSRNVTLADIDSDGDLDLLIANRLSSSVSVRFNDGTGTFPGSQEVPINYNPENVIAADLDGDGDLDLLTANYASASVSLLRNDGTGQFGPEQRVSVGNQNMPYNVIVGDLDADGDLDLTATIFAGPDANTVIVRLNNGLGFFGGGQAVPVGQGPESQDLGDVDGDGDLDLVVGNTNTGNASTVSVRLNDGSGTFAGTQNVPVGNFAAGVTLGDIDADGDPDLIVTNGFSNSVSVCFNEGSGIFGGIQTLLMATSPSAPTLADVDADGDLDLLVTALGAPGSVSVLLNGGTGLATTPAHATPAWTLAPNPAPGAATLRGAAAAAPVQVLDALGRPVLHTTTDATGTARLAPPAGLAPGLYVVRCGGQLRRLVVE